MKQISIQRLKIPITARIVHIIVKDCITMVRQNARKDYSPFQ